MYLDVSTEDMEGGNMKIKSFLIISIIVISFLGIHCSRSQSPLSPNGSFNQAVLNGTVVLSGTSTSSLGAIQIGIKGTTLYTNPDGNGNFLIKNIPTGNIVVEVSVQSDLSDLPIDNVQSGEEIGQNENQRRAGSLGIDIAGRRFLLQAS